MIRLAGGRSIVVDSKVPLEAYLDSLSAVGGDARETCLKDHARQVRDHVSRLGAKSYWEQFQPGPELVVMFLPRESLFLA